MNRRVAGLILLSLCLCWGAVAQAAGVKLGVISSRGAVEANEKWGEFATYLSQQIQTEVSLVAVSPKDVENAVTSGQVDFMLGNPVTAVILQEKYGVNPLVSMVTATGAKFAGVIVAKKGNGIEKGADLKGKKVMAFQFGTSAAAYVFQVYHLKKQGVDAHKDFAEFREAKKQDDIVLAVKAGAIDAGFIRTGILEQMSKEGVVNMDDFVIVDKQSGDFPEVHSTELYAEWMVMTAKATAADMAHKMKTALLALKPTDAGAKKAKITGFVEPLELKNLKDALKALKLDPYKS